MGDSVGSVSLDLLLNSKEFESKLNNAVNRATKNVNTKMNKGLGNTGALLGKIGKLAVAAFSVRAIANFSKECVELGSNLAEVQNVVDSTFTTMSDKVNEYAKTSIERLGMSETTYKKMVGTLGAMSKSFNFSEAEALKMSDTITALTADVASFYNLSHEEAYTKMKSIYTGETESLKELGVVMTQAALDEFALANGFGKTTKAMTEQEKVALRYQFVMKSLETASGDFQRTSNGWANQTRILSENFNKLKASIGQGLINALLPVVRVLNTLMAKLQILGEMFSNFTAKIFGKAETSTSSITSTITDLGDTAAATGESIGGIADSASEAAKKMNKTSFGFDELNTLQAPDDGSSGGGGAAGGIGEGLSTSTTEQKKLNDETSLYESILDKLIKKAQELANLFKGGFLSGLDLTGFSSSIENIKSSIESIKTSLMSIFGDGQVLNAFNSLFDNLAASLGTITGIVVGIGASIVNTLIGSISQYLDSNSGFIKSKLISIFEIGGTLITNFTSIFSNIGEIISNFLNNPTLQSIGADLLAITINPVLTATETAVKLISDIFGGINTIIEENKGKIETLLNGLLTFIEPITNSLSTMVDNLGTKLSEVYNSHIKPAIDNFTEGFSNLAGTLLDNWNTHIQPVLDNLSSKFSEVIGNNITPLLENILELGGELIEFVSVFYTNNLEPLIEKLTNFLAPILSTIAETLGGLLLDAIGLVSDAFSGLVSIVESIVQFFNEHKIACDLLEGSLLGVGVSLGIVNAKLIATKIAAAASSAATAIMTGATTAFSTVAGICSTVCGGLAAAIAFLTSPIGLVVIAITAIIAIGVALYKNWDTIKEKAAQLGQFLSGKFEDIKNWCSSKIEGLKNAVSEKWNTLKTNVSNTASSLKENVSNKFDEIKSSVSSKVSFIKDTTVEGFKILKNKASDDVNTLKNNISNRFNEIRNTASEKISNLKNNAISAFQNIKNGASTIFSGLKDTVKNIFSSLVNIIRTPVNSIISIINKAIDGINSLSIDIPDWVPVVGGESYSFNLPNIPQLANGGYVTAPTLAMVGEGRENEIVAPESKLREIRDEGTTATNSLLSQMLEQNRQLVNIMTLLLNKDQDLYLDKDKVGSLLTNYQASETRRRG